MNPKPQSWRGAKLGFESWRKSSRLIFSPLPSTACNLSSRGSWGKEAPASNNDVSQSTQRGFEQEEGLAFPFWPLPSLFTPRVPAGPPSSTPHFTSLPGSQLPPHRLSLQPRNQLLISLQNPAWVAPLRNACEFILSCLLSQVLGLPECSGHTVRQCGLPSSLRPSTPQGRAVPHLFLWASEMCSITPVG